MQNEKIIVQHTHSHIYTAAATVTATVPAKRISTNVLPLLYVWFCRYCVHYEMLGKIDERGKNSDDCCRGGFKKKGGRREIESGNADPGRKIKYNRKYIVDI